MKQLVARDDRAVQEDGTQVARYGGNNSPRAVVRRPLVEFVRASKSYRTARGHIDALREVDLSIAPGEFLSVVGPSGCGKTTMLNLVAGLESPTSGHVSFCGRKVDKPITDVGIVFQDATLMDWRNVIENVMLQIEIRKLEFAPYRKRAEQLLTSLGLARFHSALPSQLSGGMKQRVSIARALVHKPGLLLLDEPFSALDALTRDKLNIDLQDLCMAERTTALFITHSIADAVFLGERVVVMTPGPGRIAATIDVDLPKPRDLRLRETPEFGMYVGRIRSIFEQEGVL
jgi:NitT/TauT family transport system ATP-binding protein